MDSIAVRELCGILKLTLEVCDLQAHIDQDLSHDNSAFGIPTQFHGLEHFPFHQVTVGTVILGYHQQNWHASPACEFSILLQVGGQSDAAVLVRPRQVRIGEQQATAQQTEDYFVQLLDFLMAYDPRNCS